MFQNSQQTIKSANLSTSEYASRIREIKNKKDRDDAVSFDRFVNIIRTFVDDALKKDEEIIDKNNEILPACLERHTFDFKTEISVSYIDKAIKKICNNVIKHACGIFDPDAKRKSMWIYFNGETYIWG